MAVYDDLSVTKTLRLSDAAISLVGDGARMSMSTYEGRELMSLSPLSGAKVTMLRVSPEGEAAAAAITITRKGGDVASSLDNRGGAFFAGDVVADGGRLVRLAVKHHAAFGGSADVGKGLNVGGDATIQGEAKIGGGARIGGQVSCGSLLVEGAEGEALMAVAPEAAVFASASLHLRGATTAASLRVLKGMQCSTIVCSGGVRVMDILQCDGLTCAAEASFNASVHVKHLLAVGGGVVVGSSSSSSPSTFEGNVRMKASASVFDTLHVAPQRGAGGDRVRAFAEGGGGVFVGEKISLSAVSGVVECTSIKCNGTGFALNAGDGTTVRNHASGLEVASVRALTLSAKTDVLLSCGGEGKVRAPGGVTIEAPHVQLGGAGKLRMEEQSLTLACPRLRVAASTTIVGDVYISGDVRLSAGADCGGAPLRRVGEPAKDDDAATAGFVRRAMLSSLSPPQTIRFSRGGAHVHALAHKAGTVDVFVVSELRDDQSSPILYLPSSLTCEDGCVVWVNFLRSAQTHARLFVACSSSAIADSFAGAGGRDVQIAPGTTRFVLCKALGIWSVAKSA